MSMHGINPSNNLAPVRVDANGNLLVAVSGGGMSDPSPTSVIVPTAVATLNIATLPQYGAVSTTAGPGTIGVPKTMFTFSGKGVIQTLSFSAGAAASNGNLTIEFLIDGVVVATITTGAVVATNTGRVFVGHINTATSVNILSSVPFNTSYSIRVTSTADESGVSFNTLYRHYSI